MTSTVSGEAEHLLHFDHDLASRKVTTTGLRLEGFEVSDAGTIEDAIELAMEYRFRAAIIDCSRPEEAKALIDELETKTTSPVPIVLLTSRDNRVPFPGAKEFPCLVRPFTTPALSLVLYPLLGGERRSSVDIEVLERAKVSEDNLTPAPQVVMVGEYQLITEIARGGMGTVYLARRSRDAGVNRLYALKLLHAHLSDDPNFVSMLRDEAALASRINHQNVVAVNDVGTDGDQHFIVMDYVEGVSLSKLVRRKGGTVPEDIVATIFVDALQGLHGAHTVTDGRGNSLELVHRDVTPENILIGTDGATRISDFGVAKARVRLTETSGDMRKGKLAYLAPEQLIDEESVDHRVDIWAAGVSLWGALTGASLFAKQVDSEAKIMRNILEQPIAPPSTVGKKPNAFLDDVVLRALERDPARRYGSAREMSDAIRAAAMAEGLLASGAAVGEFVLSSCEAEVRERQDMARISASVSGDSLRAPPQLATQSVGMNETEVASTANVAGLTDASSPVPAAHADDGHRRPVLPFFLLGIAAAAALGWGWYQLQSPPNDPSPPARSGTADPRRANDGLATADDAVRTGLIERADDGSADEEQPAVEVLEDEPGGAADEIEAETETEAAGEDPSSVDEAPGSKPPPVRRSRRRRSTAPSAAPKSSDSSPSEPQQPAPTPPGEAPRKKQTSASDASLSESNPYR